MKQGDFQQAAREVEKLARDLESGKLDAKAKADLAKQLDAIKKKLEAAADAHHQAMEDLQRQIEQQRQAGDLAKAGELQQKLDQLAQQAPQLNQLGQLANQMGQVQQGLKQGDGKQAANALAQMAQKLDAMQNEMNELEMLDATMNELQMAKDAMACKNCQGAGCKDCQGGDGMNNMAGMNRLDNGQGPGIGTGRGNNRAQGNEPDTSARETQVRVKPGRGAGVFAGMVEGPNTKGQVQATIQHEVASFGSQPADPLTNERLPRNRREHAEAYFNALREGK
jgi:hypothetical protein